MGPAAPAATTGSPATPSATPACGTALSVARPYACVLAPLAGPTEYALLGAPEGMVVQERTGHLHWTPAPDQRGEHLVQVVRRAGERRQTSVLRLQVTGEAPVPAGIYVSPGGTDSGPGTLTAPLATVQEAADRARPGDTIYLRGGTYRNAGAGEPFDGRPGSLARIRTSGQPGAPITLRPWGNEYPHLVSDVNGLQLVDARHWRIQGLELSGQADRLGPEQALQVWWTTAADGRLTSGRGIALNRVSDVHISDVLVHHFPGAGISNTGGADITVTRSVLHSNAWWATAGTHGFANSSPAGPAGSRIVMSGNLVFGNQSSMISHVFSKGAVTLAIDEGNGLHMQDNAEQFAGTFVAEDNVAVYNGKAGLGVNTVSGAVIRRNAFYRNAQAVPGNGELSLQSATSQQISANLFQARPDRSSIRDFQRAYVGVGLNAAVPTAADDDLPSSVQRLRQVFQDPAAGDFRPAAGVRSGSGPAPSVLAALRQKVAEHGLVLAPAPTSVTPAYVRQLRAAILASWPAPTPGDGIPDGLVLRDPDSQTCYRYADRQRYPQPGRSC